MEGVTENVLAIQKYCSCVLWLDFYFIYFFIIEYNIIYLAADKKSQKPQPKKIKPGIQSNIRYKFLIKTTKFGFDVFTASSNKVISHI